MASPVGLRARLLRFSLLTALLLALLPDGSEAARKKPAETEPATTVEASRIRSLAWRPVGPANMGGRISEIALVPGRPAHFFVGTGTGGLFKTQNDGTSFTPVFDDQSLLSIGSVAVAPSDPNIVYAGTGEGNGRNSSTWGNGVYKSTDGGEHFAHQGLDDSRDIPRVAVHPKDPKIAYAAVLGHLWDANKERGLYKTIDGGATWHAALQIDENTGCVDVLLDPARPDTVYAAMYARRRKAWSFESGGFGDKGGIYKSVDGGGTFKRLTAGLPAKSGRIGLALFPPQPSHLYAVVESDEAGAAPIDDWLSKAGGIFKSVDGGEHWTRLNPLTPRSFYFSKIVVDPKDENRLYILGFGLDISDDGGRTFRANGAALPHGDMHTLVVDPTETDRLLMGTDGGVYESRDRARTWRYLDNLAIGEFYEVGLGMDSPYTICGGLQDNGSWCGPSRGRTFFGEGDTDVSEDKMMNLSNLDWFDLWDGDGYYVQIDPRDARVIYAEFQQAGIVRVDLATERITLLRPESKEGTPRFRFNWNSPFALSKHDPDLLYLGGNHLFRLARRGDAWEAISPDLSGRDPDRILAGGSGAETYGTVVTLSESPLKKGQIWIGTDDGNLQLTRDDGATWANLTPKLGGIIPKGTYVSRLEASHFDPAIAYASFDGHRTGDNRTYLAETRDFGASWRSIASDLPADGPVKVVREDPINPALLFVGTEFGVFVSLDRGGHWLSLRGDSLPAVQVHDLQIHPRDRDLVAATHGRSIYVLDDITGLEQMTPENLAKPLMLLTPRPATGFYLMARGGLWGNDSFGAKNPPYATLNYLVKERQPDGAKLEIKDPHGVVVRELKGPAEAGLNRVGWNLTLEKEQRIDPPEARITGQSPFVPAGEYEVTLSVGREKSTAKLSVGYVPGVGPRETPSQGGVE